MLIVKSVSGIEDATQKLEQTTNATDVIENGMKFNPMTPSATRCGEQFFLLSLGLLNAGGKLMVSFQEKDGYMVRLMRMIPTNQAPTDNTRLNEAAPIREGWSGRRRGICLVVTH